MRKAIAAVAATMFAGVITAQVAPSYQREAMVAYREKQYPECAAIFASALESEPPQAIIPAIGGARCYAGAGNLENASRYLQTALDRGYRNCTLLEQDTIFETLRDQTKWPEFRALCLANEERFHSSINAELFVAFLQDQEDRRPDDLDVARVRERDAQRRHLVALAIATDSLRMSEDYYHAAMVMQHGATAEDIGIARNLARKATELDPTNARALWLYAATTDRLLWSSGKPQIYGTQLKQSEGKWTREPFDSSAVTDLEREKWRVPSLAEQAKELEELNAPPTSHN